MDIIVKPSIENGKRMVDTLNEFGFEEIGLSSSDFLISLDELIKKASI